MAKQSKQKILESLKKILKDNPDLKSIIGKDSKEILSKVETALNNPNSNTGLYFGDKQNSAKFVNFIKVAVEFVQAKENHKPNKRFAKALQNYNSSILSPYQMNNLQAHRVQVAKGYGPMGAVAGGILGVIAVSIGIVLFVKYFSILAFLTPVAVVAAVALLGVVAAVVAGAWVGIRLIGNSAYKAQEPKFIDDLYYSRPLTVTGESRYTIKVPDQNYTFFQELSLAGRQTLEKSSPNFFNKKDASARLAAPSAIVYKT